MKVPDWTEGERWLFREDSKTMRKLIGLWADFLRRHECFLVLREAFEQERKRKTTFNIFSFLRGHFRGKNIDHEKIGNMYIGYTEKLPILPVAILNKYEGLTKVGAHNFLQVDETHNFFAVFDVAKSVNYKLDTSPVYNPFSSVYFDKELNPDYLEKILIHYDNADMDLQKNEMYSLALKIISDLEDGYFPRNPHL